MDERRLSRLEFLKLAGLAGAGAALLGPAAGSAAADELAERAGAARGPAYLTVAHGTNVAAITTAAVAGLGGMGRFVHKGADVIIKPNICVDYHGPEYAATTNPTVVATLVKLCRSAGAKRVRVMDDPFGGTAQNAYERSGIGPAARKAGAQMVIMSPLHWKKYSIPHGKDIKSWTFYRDILECDVLINVPIAKNHGLTRLTLGGKNMLGVVANPGGLHQNSSQRIADIVSLIKPDLTVVDAVRILVRNGPTGGSLSDVKRKNKVIASKDIVAADAYAATLFGLKGSAIPYVKAMDKMKLGTMDLSKIDIRTYNL